MSKHKLTCENINCKLFSEMFGSETEWEKVALTRSAAMMSDATGKSGRVLSKEDTSDISTNWIAYEKIGVLGSLACQLVVSHELLRVQRVDIGEQVVKLNIQLNEINERLVEKLASQRRSLCAETDDVKAELKCVREAAKTEIETLQRQLAGSEEKSRDSTSLVRKNGVLYNEIEDLEEKLLICQEALEAWESLNVSGYVPDYYYRDYIRRGEQKLNRALNIFKKESERKYVGDSVVPDHPDVDCGPSKHRK